MEDYPEIRNWLAEKENVESIFKKSPYLVTIKDSNGMSILSILDMNKKISPSAILCTVNGQIESFWDYVYENQQNIPYENRLAMYLPCYLVY